MISCVVHRLVVQYLPQGGIILPISGETDLNLEPVEEGSSYYLQLD